MKWVWLFSSIACELVGTTCLKLSSGESPHASRYFIGVAVFYALCFVLLGQAMKQFSLGAVYAIWSGIGVACLAAIGVVFFGDPINALKVISLMLVIAGIVGLNLSGISH